MKIRCVYNQRVVRLFGIRAITVYPWVLFDCKETEVPESLFRHELEHVYQVQRTGWLRFYYTYLKFYFLGRLHGCDHQKAYLDIPFEIEARNAEKNKITESEKAALGILENRA